MRRNKGFLLTGCLLLMLLLVACAGGPKSVSAGSLTTSARVIATPSVGTAVPGGSGCHPASPVIQPPANATPVAGVALPQVQGHAPGGELWALIFNGWPMQAHMKNKIVWRMTGSGDFRLVAHGPAGQVLQPTDFIFHEGSNWQRPGEEWGSTFTFPASGCWDVHASRGNLVGDVWFVIE